MASVRYYLSPSAKAETPAGRHIDSPRLECRGRRVIWTCLDEQQPRDYGWSEGAHIQHNLLWGASHSGSAICYCNQQPCHLRNNMIYPPATGDLLFPCAAPPVRLILCHLLASHAAAAAVWCRIDFPFSWHARVVLLFDKGLLATDQTTNHQQKYEWD